MIKPVNRLILFCVLIYSCKTTPKEFTGICSRYKIYYHPKQDIYFLKDRATEFGGYVMGKYQNGWYGYTYVAEGYNGRVYKAGPYESLEAAVQAQELKITVNGRIDYDDDFNIKVTSYQYNRDRDGALTGITPEHSKKNLINKSEFQTICN